MYYYNIYITQLVSIGTGTMYRQFSDRHEKRLAVDLNIQSMIS